MTTAEHYQKLWKKQLMAKVYVACFCAVLRCAFIVGSSHAVHSFREAVPS